jgi:hypothetical protein
VFFKLLDLHCWIIAPLSPLRERDSLTSSVAGTTGCCRRNGQETVLSARSAGHWSLTILPIINSVLVAHLPWLSPSLWGFPALVSADLTAPSRLHGAAAHPGPAFAPSRLLFFYKIFRIHPPPPPSPRHELKVLPYLLLPFSYPTSAARICGRRFECPPPKLTHGPDNPS